ncbi:MAG: glycosyl hydrolase family 53 [Firmicutes bacterium]|nr:glycosyl hydrolase family 53 [Bacillota bacterium]
MDRLLIKGMTYGWGASRGEYRTESAKDSLEQLRETGSEWIALSFWTWQDTVYSTEIPFDYGYTVTDRDIAAAVANAKELGLKVCLKPVVNSRDGIWRAHIGFPPEEGSRPYWDKWFKSYEQFLVHYAELAQELGCEMFCVGCEMVKSEAQEAHWRAVIARVREVYQGPLIYNANHGSEEGVRWFDAVDLIGTSAYYPVADGPGETEDNMLMRWQATKERFVRLHEQFQKPIVFMEIGCRSAQGCAAMPWDFTHRDLPVDETEQARFYRSALRAFWDEPWFGGFFWWDWSTKLYPAVEASRDRGFDIYGKQAEVVLREWYKGVPGAL